MRVELADGSLDPWGQNKLFGIRQLNVHGKGLTRPESPAAVLKVAASYRLNKETVLCGTEARAADAGDRQPNLSTLKRTLGEQSQR